MEYIKNLLTAIDQLGNAISGGNPDVTISSRVGFHSAISERGGFWRVLERVIDFTFEPIDGKNHCLESALLDDDKCTQLPNTAAFITLGVIVMVSCLLLVPVIRVLSLFYKNT